MNFRGSTNLLPGINFAESLGKRAYMQDFLSKKRKFKLPQFKLPKEEPNFTGFKLYRKRKNPPQKGWVLF
jgi:hypothetical protein